MHSKTVVRVGRVGRAGVVGALRSLAARRSPVAVFVMAFALSLPSLGFGLSVDEYFQRAALSSDGVFPGVARAPWDLFTFSRSALVPSLREDGILPWWTDPEYTTSFFRPLASLTLYADHVLWGHSAPLFHLQSIAWYLLLLCAVWRLYREFNVTAQLPVLALFLYALDDARAQVVGWASARNASIALLPAIFALIVHHRYRRGGGFRYGLLAPCLLALGLLGGEVAVSIIGYLVAYAVFLDRGSVRARALPLLPYFVVIALYRVFYNAHGFGALYSGLYVDPVREPVAFLWCLVTHLPVLLFAQFAPLPAELWEPYALIAPWLQPLVFALVLLGLAGLTKLLWPLLRSTAEARFWALGCVLGAMPFCATFPADRLLMATSLGGAALLSRLLLSLLEETRWGRARRALGYTLIAVHCLLAPLYFTVRSRDLVITQGVLANADRSIASEPELADKTLIIVNPALCPLGVYFPLFRSAQGRQLPRTFRYLADGESAISVERVDEHTLRLRPEDGFVFSTNQRVFRRQRAFQEGERIALSDMSFTVSEVRADGRPAEVLVRLDKELEDPSLQWVRWEQREYVPFVPPKLGQRVVLPKVDTLSLMFDDADPS